MAAASARVRECGSHELQSPAPRLVRFLRAVVSFSHTHHLAHHSLLSGHPWACNAHAIGSISLTRRPS